MSVIIRYMGQKDRQIGTLGCLRLHTDRKIPSENPGTDFFSVPKLFRNGKFSGCAGSDTDEIGTEYFRSISVVLNFYYPLVVLIFNFDNLLINLQQYTLKKFIEINHKRKIDNAGFVEKQDNYRKKNLTSFRSEMTSERNGFRKIFRGFFPFR